MTHARLLPILCLLVAGLLSCDDDDDRGFYNDPCRFEPGLCAGGLGGFCGANIDCDRGFCCKQPKECGGGVCTFACRNDYDCPTSMGCEHDVCLFICRSDFDCASGQHCGHAHTVCEW